MMNNWIVVNKNSHLKDNKLLLNALKKRLNIIQDSEIQWCSDLDLIDSKLRDIKLNSKYVLILFNLTSKEIFILLSSAKREYTAGRNTYLSQGFKSFLEIKIQIEQKMGYKINREHVFLFLDKYETEKIPSSILTAIRSFLTIYSSKSILNDDLRFNNIKVFNSLDEFIEEKTRIREKNTGNNATFIEKAIIHFDSEISETYINAFLKFDGANAGDSLLIYETLRYFYNGKIYIYWLKENLKEKSYLYKNLFLKDENLIFLGSNEPIDQSIKRVLLQKKEKNKNKFIAKRNQAKFHNNLFCLFGKKECLLCKVSISDLIIGSHIKRVADILNDVNLDEKQKQCEVEDANNGFWLCVLHDKMFENGKIWFDKNNVMIWDKQPKNHIEYIDDTLQKKKYDPKFLSSKRLSFQKEHYLRISNSIF